MEKIILSKDPESREDISCKIVKVLRQGGLVIVPTDTVYGLLVDAQNKEAIEKLMNFKERPKGKPVSVFLANFEQIKKYVEVTDKQIEVLKKLLPGPFTIILKSKHKVDKELESEEGNLGVRLPKYKFIEDIVNIFGSPVTATSANLSGRSSVYSIDSLLRTLSQKKLDLIDLVIDAGKLPRNKPSTVIDLTQEKIRILRKGDIFFDKTQTFISRSQEQTKEIAKNILKKFIDNTKNKPLIFIFEGELGVGKTVFVKGIGEALGIKDIVSPTFVIYYEYEIKSARCKAQCTKLLHVDLYNIQEDKEFEHLGLEEYLRPGNILCFEWGEKVGVLWDLLKEKGKVAYVKMEYVNENERKISWRIIN